MADASGRVRVVSVVSEDRDLARRLPAARLESARRAAVARVAWVPAGRWSPPEQTPDETGGLGMLVLEGVLVEAVSVGGRQGVELFGPGDLARPSEPAGNSYVPARVRWSAITPARLAVLDARFTSRMCAYPEVIAALAGRIERRAFAHALRFAIVQQPRLAARLHLLLWHLADRFGRVHATGVILPLALSHGLLAELVGAQRPSVSGALKELERGGVLARRRDGSWWLGEQPPEGQPCD